MAIAHDTKFKKTARILTKEMVPFIYNVTLVENVENSQALPENVRKFAIRARKNSGGAYPEVDFAYEADKVPPAVGEVYASIQDGMPYGEDNLRPENQLTLYLSTPDGGGAIVEIIAWT